MKDKDGREHSEKNGQFVKMADALVGDISDIPEIKKTPVGVPVKKEKTKDELWGAEHKGYKEEQAINILLKEKSGHVKNAFNRPEIGDIDLIWGDETGGLDHIIKRRDKMLSEGKGTISGLDMVNKIPDIIRNGTVINSKYVDRAYIEHQNCKTTIRLDYDGDNSIWLVSAMEILK